MADELSTTKPSSAVGTGARRNPARATPTTPAKSISIASYMMSPGPDKIGAERIHEILTRKSSPPKVTAEMKAAAADISGRWEVSIDFYTSKSLHTFYIEKQEGNWLTGTHKGEFATRELAANIDGDEVRFQNRNSVPGDNLAMTFYGKLYGDSITGEIDMVEHVTAKFTEKKPPIPTAAKASIFRRDVPYPPRFSRIRLGSSVFYESVSLANIKSLSATLIHYYQNKIKFLYYIILPRICIVI